MLDKTIHHSRALITFSILVLGLGFLAACGSHGADEHAAMDHSETTDSEMAEEATSEGAEMAMDGAPRVFFANVADGDEVTSPVTLEFGIENFEIVKAQDPIVIEEGKGHHHLGVNTHCLEPGVIIEKAQPWIHFGDGSNTIDLQLPPGPAHLALQVGDGEHRTLDEPGLCAMISLTVVEDEASE